MRRFYYTDPLAAAWMADKFRMRFTNKDGAECVWNREFNIFECHGHVRTWPKIKYIHPDSLHLLEPQKGDIGLNEINSSGEFRDNEFRDGEYLSVSGCKTIYRNGIAFIYPESEE